MGGFTGGFIGGFKGLFQGGGFIPCAWRPGFMPGFMSGFMFSAAMPQVHVQEVSGVWFCRARGDYPARAHDRWAKAAL